jgi:hypothetical protein
MRAKNITQFMWGFQPNFRRSVEWDVQRSLKTIGVDVEPTVFLIGVLIEGGSRLPLCVEPENGPIGPADFDGLRDRARELYSQDPSSNMSFSDQRSHKRKHQEFLDRAYGTAIGEVLETRLGPGHRFFIGLPTLVEEHRVFTAVGIPEQVLQETPRLKSERGKEDFDRYLVTQSLIQGVLDEALRLSSRALYLPDPGGSLDGIGDAADIAKASGKAALQF